LFGCVSQGLHSPTSHLAHVFNRHCGPLGLLRRRSLGCASCSRLALHQLVDRKVANGYKRRNVLDGHFHLGQSRVNMWIVGLEAHD
jgi:hypothetical protein